LKEYKYGQDLQISTFGMIFLLNKIFFFLDRNSNTKNKAGLFNSLLAELLKRVSILTNGTRFLSTPKRPDPFWGPS
jgi:hypothetical protein